MKNTNWNASRVALTIPALFAVAVLATPLISYGQVVFVNELHYDNSSTDVGESIEIAAPAGTDLGAFSIVLYNGSNGLVYNTRVLSGIVPDQDNGFGTLAFDYPTNGIQNGSPDGIALISGASVVQFLSYEGTLTANDGPATGQTSTDIGVAESSSTPAGSSLQLTGSGTTGSDFNWALPQPNTFGAVNSGQSFGGGPGGPPPSPNFSINEFLADPASGAAGDANGDGTRNGSADEFVELVNTSPLDIDVSGWILSDAVGMRHVFPAGSIVQGNCAIVVFGGDTPTGTFGGAVVQTASSGFLGLNNSGDSITLANIEGGTVSASYGSEGGNNQSLTLDPEITGNTYVQHSAAADSNGRLFSPGTRRDGSQFSGCDLLPQGPFEIFEIQGDGDASPFAGLLIDTRANIVTVVGPEGFFMQTPDGRADAGIDTSNGIYVFTGATPSVAVGDSVDVVGEVREFFGFTEFTGNPSVTVMSSGHALPAPVPLGPGVPSMDPSSPSCAIEFECYEGMLVQIVNGTVGGPNQRFGSDPIAEVHISAAPTRPFREPGVEFPGLGMPGIATWDGNPEIFELDPDKLGLPNLIIPAGSQFDAIGALGFEFGGYELWPAELTVSEAEIPKSVRSRQRAELTIGSLNMFRFFDDVDDAPDMNSSGEVRDDFVVSTAEYDRRRSKFAAYIMNTLGAPDILAVQEVENLKVLQDLAAEIAGIDATVIYSAYLEEGNDVGTIDVGFLVRDSVAVDAITQFGKDEILPFDGSLLNDRPPLLLEGRAVDDGADYPVAVIVVHGRSLGGIDSSSDGDRVRAKRLAQAQSLASVVQTLQTDNPDIRLVVTGDFNAFEFSDGYVDVMGQVTGTVDPGENLLSGPDLVEPDLINQVLSVAEEERYSFVFRGSAQTLDHALTSMSLDASFRGLEFGRGNADAAVDLLNDPSTVLRASDHDGLVLFVTKDLDNDGVNDDGDICPATAIPESVPTQQLGVARFALTDGDFTFDSGPGSNGTAAQEFSTLDTAGCSCEQIIEIRGLGNGHEKFGCSIGQMKRWVDEVSSLRQ